MKKAEKITIMLIIIIILFGCFNSGTSEISPLETPGVKEEPGIDVNIETEVVFMVYMGADNDLNGGDQSEYNSTGDMTYIKSWDVAKMDLDEMLDSNINSDRIKVLVYGDFFFDESNVQGIYIKDGKNLKLLKEIDEPNTGANKNLTFFLDYVAENYSSKKYILDFWGHGSAWEDDIYKSLNNPSKSVSYDFSSDVDSLDMWELEKGINNSKLNFIDILMFDACLMGSIEVAYQLKDNSDYLLFSPELVSGYGYQYEDMLNYINSNYANDTKSLAVGIHEQNTKSYKPGGDFYFFNNYFVFSVVDQSKLSNLIDELNILSEYFIDEVGSQYNYILNDSLSYGVEGGNLYSSLVGYTDFTYYVDLGDLLINIKELSDVTLKCKSQITKVEEAINEYVIYNEYMNSYSLDFEKSSGLSIYLNMMPYTESTLNPLYLGASSFAQDTKWGEFIQNY